MEWAKTTARRDEKHLRFVIWVWLILEVWWQLKFILREDNTKAGEDKRQGISSYGVDPVASNNQSSEH